MTEHAKGAGHAFSSIAMRPKTLVAQGEKPRVLVLQIEAAQNVHECLERIVFQARLRAHETDFHAVGVVPCRAARNPRFPPW